MHNKISLALLAGFTYLLSGCDKTEPYDTMIPRSEVHFNGATSRSVLVEDPATPVEIEIGTTDVSNADRTVTYNITSPSGAAAGVEYTGASSGTVTIPAGEAIANITIQPIASAFPLDSKDTLYIALVQPSLNASQFADTLRLILRGQSSATCSEDAPVMADWNGAFDATEVFGTGTPYGPYGVTVSNATQTSATTGTFQVSNLWDTGWGPVTFTLDWTDPSAPTTTVVGGDVTPSDAGDLNSTYAGQLVAVRPHATQTTGTYSFCNQTATLVMQLGVSGLGWFAGLYTVTIERP